MRDRTRRDEGGVAMITVMMIVVVLTLLMVAAIGYAVQGEPLSRRDQDWNAALAAAQAGVDDYLYRLQQDDNYYLYSSTVPPTPANQAFTGWTTIPGPANQGQFHYSVSLAQYASQGIVQLSSTGRVRGVQRTIRANLRRRNFLDYLYLTDYEALDPQSGYYPDPATATAQCSRYWWAGRPTSPCVRISFVTGDAINGPMHTNDTISVNGSPTFNGKATTGYADAMTCPASPTYTYRWFGRSGCGDTPQFQTDDPEAVSLLTLPTSNTSIKAETSRPSKTGCLYNGPTRIVLTSAGRMNVTSPFTTSASYAACVGTGVALPTNGVIYVQNVPSSQSGSCSGGQNPLGYPILADVTSYQCRVGDVFLSGTLRGRLTIAAENNIVVVANTTYASSGAGSNDMLGLIANQFVQVYHPVTAARQNLTDNRTGLFQDPRIDAAILALGHSFIVQNYDDGAPLGTLSVTGGIAQKWRGPVGTGGSSGASTGYLKNYGYDPRLQYASPPHAASLSSADFRVNQWAEVANPGGLPA
jgi:Flp pilus assembly pilin Flp